MECRSFPSDPITVKRRKSICIYRNKHSTAMSSTIDFIQISIKYAWDTRRENNNNINSSPKEPKDPTDQGK